MLATLAIINMAIAAALINETVDETKAQESTEIVAVIETASNELPAELSSDK